MSEHYKISGKFNLGLVQFDFKVGFWSVVFILLLLFAGYKECGYSKRKDLAKQLYPEVKINMLKLDQVILDPKIRESVGSDTAFFVVSGYDKKTLSFGGTLENQIQAFYSNLKALNSTSNFADYERVKNQGGSILNDFETYFLVRSAENINLQATAASIDNTFVGLPKELKSRTNFYLKQNHD